MSACQFWRAECEKKGLSGNRTGGSPDGEPGSETSLAINQSSRSDYEYLEWEEQNPRPDLRQIEDVA